MTIDFGQRVALHSISLHAKALTDIKANLEDAIRTAWQQRIPNQEIAEAAGCTNEAAIRMLAKRRGWQR